MRLMTDDHDRGVAGLTYVYPVVSRRSRGVSVGINLSPNNACNWRCCYCQVPGLVRGPAPEIDLDLLRRELEDMLHALVRGDYMERHVPEGSRRINDVAFSGNGEPTASPRFVEAVEIAAGCVAKHPELAETKLVLITNGSLVHKDSVQRGLRRMAEANGEIWFKLDTATKEGQERINANRTSVARVLENLRTAASLCPTWLQTIVFATDGEPPSPSETDAWLARLEELRADGVRLAGILLYGLARPPRQPGGDRLSKVSEEWFDAFAARIRDVGFEVRSSP